MCVVSILSYSYDDARLLEAMHALRAEGLTVYVSFVWMAQYSPLMEIATSSGIYRHGDDGYKVRVRVIG